MRGSYVGIAAEVSVRRWAAKVVFGTGQSLGAVAYEGNSGMPISVNLDALLDKAYESTPIAELANAPVSALAGVSEADGEALLKAFNIKTIGDLAGNKYIKAARAITELGSLAK